jgi:hypothetical protein
MGEACRDSTMAMNEVWESAMHASRSIDYMPDEPLNNTPGRRR